MSNRGTRASHLGPRPATAGRWDRATVAPVGPDQRKRLKLSLSIIAS